MAWNPATLQSRDILLYRLADNLSGILLCFALVFSPWAFGATQPWSIWSLNVCGYVLGVALLYKLWLRWGKGYRPKRWDSSNLVHHSPSCQCPAVWLGLLTVAILGYCLTSALNARATYDPAQVNFTYHNYIRWLPASLDSTRTWSWFWNLVGLACTFWALRDWLLGKTDPESRAPEHKPGQAPLPNRLKVLLWLLAINGALLGLEGILQRYEGSGRLLFLVKPRVNPGAESQFGPFAYRANASSYFNLVWPVCLGFWHVLQERRKRAGIRHALLPCAAIMAACPIISTSRGGAFITVALLTACIALLAIYTVVPAFRRHNRSAPKLGAILVVTGFAAVALFLGYKLGWKSLKPRITAGAMLEGFNVREEMYLRAEPMARDYPVFGTGPGTFETVFQLYRISTETYWPAQLHNDWLETRITFGWFGATLIGMAILIALAAPFVGGTLRGTARLYPFLVLAIAGCVAHSRYDFPFQIYSILLLFIAILAMCSCVSARSHTAP